MQALLLGIQPDDFQAPLDSLTEPTLRCFLSQILRLGGEGAPNPYEALNRLEEEDPEKAGIVMLRYFTGLTTEETAAVLNVSVSTIERKWRVIRAWLRRELGERGGENSDG